MMRTTEVTTVLRRLARVSCALLCLLPLALVGCGGDGGGSTPGGSSNPVSSGPDKSADFGLVLDSASKSTKAIPGQAVAITLDLVSSNGFAGPITLSVDGVETGWTVAFATSTVSSLPTGVTKVVLNVTAPANSSPGSLLPAGRIKAVGGGITRYLDSGDIHPVDEGGPPPAGQLLLRIGE